MKPHEAEIREFVLKTPEYTSAWLGGSQATGRDDGLSDIDLVLVCADTKKAFGLFETFLASVTTLELVHVETRRALYDQRFYVLSQTPETYYLDVCVFDSPRPEDYAEFFNEARHGRPLVLKDEGLLEKASRLVSPQSPPFDRALFRGRSEIYYRTFLKEAARGKFADAFHFYYGLLQQWVQLHRLLLAPQKHDFSLRYLRLDLGDERADFLERALGARTFEEMREEARRVRDDILRQLG